MALYEPCDDPQRLAEHVAVWGQESVEFLSPLRGWIPSKETDLRYFAVNLLSEFEYRLVCVEVADHIRELLVLHDRLNQN